MPGHWGRTRQQETMGGCTDRIWEISSVVHREVQLPSCYGSTILEIFSKMAIRWSVILYTESIFLLLLDLSECPSIARGKAIPAVNAFAFKLRCTIPVKEASAKHDKLKRSRTPRAQNLWNARQTQARSANDTKLINLPLLQAYDKCLLKSWQCFIWNVCTPKRFQYTSNLGPKSPLHAEWHCLQGL